MHKALCRLIPCSVTKMSRLMWVCVDSCCSFLVLTLFYGLYMLVHSIWLIKINSKKMVSFKGQWLPYFIFKDESLVMYEKMQSQEDLPWDCTWCFEFEYFSRCCDGFNEPPGSCSNLLSHNNSVKLYNIVFVFGRWRLWRYRNCSCVWTISMWCSVWLVVLWGVCKMK